MWWFGITPVGKSNKRSNISSNVEETKRDPEGPADYCFQLTQLHTATAGCRSKVQEKMVPDVGCKPFLAPGSMPSATLGWLGNMHDSDRATIDAWVGCCDGWGAAESQVHGPLGTSPFTYFAPAAIATPSTAISTVADSNGPYPPRPSAASPSRNKCTLDALIPSAEIEAESTGATIGPDHASTELHCSELSPGPVSAHYYEK